MKLTQITPYNRTQQNNKAMNNNQKAPSFTSKVVFDELAVKACEEVLGLFDFTSNQVELKGFKEALEKTTGSAKIGGTMNFSGTDTNDFLKLSYITDDGKVLSPKTFNEFTSTMFILPKIANVKAPFDRAVNIFVQKFETILQYNGLNGNENPFSALANKLNK